MAETHADALAMLRSGARVSRVRDRLRGSLADQYHHLPGKILHHPIEQSLHLVMIACNLLVRPARESASLLFLCCRRTSYFVSASWGILNLFHDALSPWN